MVQRLYDRLYDRIQKNYRIYLSFDDRFCRGDFLEDNKKWHELARVVRIYMLFRSLEAHACSCMLTPLFHAQTTETQLHDVTRASLVLHRLFKYPWSIFL